MRRLILLAAAFLALAPRAAAAAHFSGAYLYHICGNGPNGKDAVPGGHTACEAYIDGVLDYHNVLQSLGIAPSVDVCIPKDVSSGELRAIVLAYMDKNPQNDSFIAAPAVTMALYEVFPCHARTSRKRK
jgi:hypothetical protein